MEDIQVAGYFALMNSVGPLGTSGWPSKQKVRLTGLVIHFLMFKLCLVPSNSLLMSSREGTVSCRVNPTDMDRCIDA